MLVVGGGVRRHSFQVAPSSRGSFTHFKDPFSLMNSAIEYRLFCCWAWACLAPCSLVQYSCTCEDIESMCGLLTTIEKNLLLHRNCKRIIETISQSFWPKLYGPIVVWLGWSPFYNYVQKQSFRSLWNAAKPDTYYVWLIFLNHHKYCCGSSKRDLLFIYHCRTPGKIPINDTHNGKKEKLF